MKFILNKPPVRYLTQDEIKQHSADIAGQLVAAVREDMKSRFAVPAGEPVVLKTDIYQVVVTALAVAEGILAAEALQHKLPPDKIKEIREGAFAAAVQVGG